MNEQQSLLTDFASIFDDDASFAAAFGTLDDKDLLALDEIDAESTTTTGSNSIRKSLPSTIMKKPDLTGSNKDPSPPPAKNDKDKDNKKDTASLYYFYKDFSTMEDPDPSVPVTKNGRIPSFPAKMYAILSRPDLQDIISWMPHGRSWKVHKPREFEVKVIPSYFEHSKFSSFIRQANGWGFRRMISKGPDRNSYYHELFLRGKPHLLKIMKRPTTNKKPLEDANTEPDFYRIASDQPLPQIKADSEFEELVRPKKRSPHALPCPVSYAAAASAPRGGNLNYHHHLQQHQQVNHHQQAAPYQVPSNHNACFQQYSQAAVVTMEPNRVFMQQQPSSATHDSINSNSVKVHQGYMQPSVNLNAPQQLPQQMMALSAPTQALPSMPPMHTSSMPNPTPRMEYAPPQQTQAPSQSFLGVEPSLAMDILQQIDAFDNDPFAGALIEEFWENAPLLAP